MTRGSLDTPANNVDRYAKGVSERLVSLRGIIYELDAREENASWAELANILQFWPKDSEQLAANHIINYFRGREDVAREIPNDIIALCKGNAIGIVLDHIRQEANAAAEADNERSVLDIVRGYRRSCMLPALLVGGLYVVDFGLEYLITSDDCRIVNDSFVIPNPFLVNIDPIGDGLDCLIEPPILPFFDSELACADPGEIKYEQFMFVEIERTYGLRAPLDTLIGKDLQCDVEWTDEVGRKITCKVIVK